MKKLILALALLAAPAAADDEVILKNGDRITGKVKGMAGGKLEIATAHSGSLKVDWAQVVSVRTEGKIAVKMTTGEMVEGKLEAGQNGRLKVATEGPAQPVEIDPAKVKFFNEPPVQWHGNLSISARSTDGNTHNRSGIASGDFLRATETDEFLIRAIYRYSEQSGEIQERNSYGLGKYSYKFTDRFYGFASIDLLSDRFKDLKLQTVVAVGAGYDVLKESWIEFSAEAGLAYVDNNYDEIQRDEDHMGARASARLALTLPLGFAFKDVFTIYPNFDDSQDFQIRNEATLSNALGDGWSLIGGVITEYDREPTTGVGHHDNTYFVGLGYAF